MKRMISLCLILMMILASTIPGFAEEWPPIGSADAPVHVTFILKDVFPNEPDVVSLLEQIEAKMAAHGQYIDLELLEPPASSYGTALPLALRSGELAPDIIYFQGGELPVAQEGLLEDLTGSIEKSTFVKGMLEPENVERMKNFPYVLWLATPRVPIPVMREDYTLKLSTYEALLADPTPDNYYAFFKEMKDAGLVEAAISMDGTLDRLNTLFNHAFGVTGNIVKEDGKWIYAMGSQAEKAKLAFYAKLYAGGLLHPDFITDAWDALEQKFYESKIGVIAGTAGDVIQIYNNKMTAANGAEAKLVVLPPAKGVSQSYTSIDTTKEPRGFAINVDSKVKDAAWAVLEFMASPEGRLLDKVGIEGVHYNVTDGKIVFTERFPEWWARFWPTPLHLEPATPLEKPVLVESAQASLDAVAKYAHNDTNIIVPAEMAPYMDAMKALYTEYAIDIVTGAKPIEAFDDFVKEFKAAGGDVFSEYLKTVLG